MSNNPKQKTILGEIIHLVKNSKSPTPKPLQTPLQITNSDYFKQIYIILRKLTNNNIYELFQALIKYDKKLKDILFKNYEI